MIQFPRGKKPEENSEKTAKKRIVCLCTRDSAVFAVRVPLVVCLFVCLFMSVLECFDQQHITCQVLSAISEKNKEI